MSRKNIKLKIIPTSLNHMFNDTYPINTKDMKEKGLKLFSVIKSLLLTLLILSSDYSVHSFSGINLTNKNQGLQCDHRKI